MGVAKSRSPQRCETRSLCGTEAMKKHCIVCGAPFDARGRALTCSQECSKQNARDYNARWWQQRPDKHTRKIAREMATTQRAINRLPYVEAREREYRREWRERNRERMAEYQRKWAKENRDRTRKYTKRYRARNPDKAKAWSLNYETAHRDERNAKRRERRRAQRALRDGS